MRSRPITKTDGARTSALQMQDSKNRATSLHGANMNIEEDESAEMEAKRLNP